jgi:hypothetical protein
MVHLQKILVFFHLYLHEILLSYIATSSVKYSVSVLETCELQLTGMYEYVYGDLLGYALIVLLLSK